MKAVDIQPLSPASTPELLQQLGQLPCGFPSPGLDYEEPPLSLDELVGMRAPSMFVGQATGSSMRDRGIFEGDYLIIDRALDPKPGDVIVVRIGPDYTVKKYSVSAGVKKLEAENPDSTPIKLGEDEQVEIFGVVTFNLRQQRSCL